MSKSGKSKSNEETAEAVEGDEHDTVVDDNGETAGPHPLVDLTEEKPPARRFYANLADL